MAKQKSLTAAVDSALQSKFNLNSFKNKKGLDNYEVALLAYDIQNYNQQLEQAKQKKEKIRKK